VSYSYSILIRCAVLVQGPYLVRSATLNQDTNTLELTGDTDGSDQITTVFAASKAGSVTWNGRNMEILSKNGNMLAFKTPTASPFSLPALGRWKVHDSLPEIQANYTPSLKTWTSTCPNRTMCGHSDMLTRLSQPLTRLRHLTPSSQTHTIRFYTLMNTGSITAHTSIAPPSQAPRVHQRESFSKSRAEMLSGSLRGSMAPTSAPISACLTSVLGQSNSLLPTQPLRAALRTMCL